MIFTLQRVSPKNARQQWPGVFLCLLFLVAGGAQAQCPAPGELDWVQLERVVDGDTLRLDDGRSVRLIAVNTPELARGRRAAQPLAAEARAAVRDFFEGEQRLGLAYGQQRHDRHDRDLAHVYRSDGQSLAAHLLSLGLAWRIAVPPNLANQSCLAGLELQARRAGRGVWSAPGLQARPAIALNTADAGFQRVRGSVDRVVETRRGWWIEMGRLSLRLARHDRGYFGPGEPDNWSGKSVEVRGWVIDRGDSKAVKAGHHPPFMMVIRHPSMLSFRESP